MCKTGWPVQGPTPSSSSEERPHAQHARNERVGVVGARCMLRGITGVGRRPPPAARCRPAPASRPERLAAAPAAAHPPWPPLWPPPGPPSMPAQAQPPRASCRRGTLAPACAWARRATPLHPHKVAGQEARQPRQSPTALKCKAQCAWVSGVSVSVCAARLGFAPSCPVPVVGEAAAG